MGGIYLRYSDEFVAMREQPYEAEDLLQALIADHPEVLAGDEQEDGRAWLLVKREAGVADTDEGAERWSLDHLFLDQEGVPTLVEVKRSSDTRARREVVAQMLDYAANATAHWKVEALRAWFEAQCDRQGVDHLAALDSAFGVTEEDAYWESVRKNLASDRIRLVFVADEIAPELRSIIEYLNRQMADTEVLAIEVRQYVDEAGERQTIVPRLLGQTEAAKAAKGGVGRTTRQWDEESLLAEIASGHGDDVAEIARSVITWADAQPDVQVLYGQGVRSGSAKVRLRGDAALSALNIYSYDAIEIPFDLMRSSGEAPFAESREVRDELRRRINEAVPAADLPSEEERIRPSFSLTAIADAQTRQRFFDAIAWALDQARQAQRTPPSAP